MSTNNNRKLKRNDAKIITNCFAGAALAINSLNGNDIKDSPAVMQELVNSYKNIQKGNISEIEQMLISQAKALDYVFCDALNKLVDLDMVNHIELFTNIAFRSQNQCRKTLAVLAELKNPRRATFIKQQNNAVNQQINNQPMPNSEKKEKVANELLKERKHAQLDKGRTPETINIDSNMAALEKVHGPKDR
jgi:hypothetical protein